MAGKVVHLALKEPNVVREIAIGLALGVLVGGIWKMNHWNNQRKIRAFYGMLDKGEIIVVVDEE